MLRTRFSPLTGNNKCGAGQGDVLSMQLFIQCIDPIIEKMATRYDGNIICYADDILVGLRED